MNSPFHLIESSFEQLQNKINHEMQIIQKWKNQFNIILFNNLPPIKQHLHNIYQIVQHQMGSLMDQFNRTITQIIKIYTSRVTELIADKKLLQDKVNQLDTQNSYLKKINQSFHSSINQKTNINKFHIPSIYQNVISEEKIKCTQISKISKSSEILAKSKQKQQIDKKDYFYKNLMSSLKNSRKNLKLKNQKSKQRSQKENLQLIESNRQNSKLQILRKSLLGRKRNSIKYK